MIYSLSRSNVALVTTNDLLSILCAASRQMAILEVVVGGMGTASAANELGLFRATIGTTPGGAVTAAPLRVEAAAAVFTNATTWAVQPALGSALLRLPVNANGGIFRWVARPGSEIILRNSEVVSFRSVVGTSTVSFYCLVDEY